ncbi:MAG: hypothetical protein KKF93_06290 [Candidatus Omnitrophica bacterium]|nr:hypothetical protein [Candidatus Omnitrophota bacterium]
MKKTKNVIIAVTGSISAYKACELVRLLCKRGNKVNVLMSKAATHFVTPLTFQTLSKNPVVIDMFEDPLAWDPQHVALAQGAHVVAVVPATANVIAKLAQGICDDIITCVIAATRAKVVVCPAMNENMYTHPATQDNIARLKRFGYRIIEPVKGELACGKVGIGRLADLDKIISEIEKALK